MRPVMRILPLRSGRVIRTSFSRFMRAKPLPERFRGWRPCAGFPRPGTRPRFPGGGRPPQGGHRGPDRLHVLGKYLAAVAQPGPAARCREQCQPGTWREPRGARAGAAFADQRLHVVEQRLGDGDRGGLALPAPQVRRGGHGPELVQGLPSAHALEQQALHLRFRVAEADAHEKAVELGFRQGKGSHLVRRVLRGDDEEGIGQGAGLALGGDLALLHGFEQCALGLGRGAVDLVGQDQLGEDGTGMEVEAFRCAVVDRHPDDVCGQQVAGELDALVVQVEEGGQEMGEGGLAHARQVLDEQVSAAQQAGHGQAQDPGLAEDDVAGLPEERFQPRVLLQRQYGGVHKRMKLHENQGVIITKQSG